MNNQDKGEKKINKFIFDELKINRIALWEQLLLLFVRPQVAQDIFDGKKCTVKFKKLFGKFYVVDSQITNL